MIPNLVTEDGRPLQSNSQHFVNCRAKTTDARNIKEEPHCVLFNCMLL
jgi:hypothetical protein